MNYQPAQKPTFYFIGVTTGKSSIMRVFPAWAQHLGLGDVKIKGINLKIHDEPERYREAVSFLKNDPLSLGALVTTHKLDLLKASRDLFEGRSWRGFHHHLSLAATAYLFVLLVFLRAKKLHPSRGKRCSEGSGHS